MGNEAILRSVEEGFLSCPTFQPSPGMTCRPKKAIIVGEGGAHRLTSQTAPDVLDRAVGIGV